MTEIAWEIGSLGRSWRTDEAMERYFMAPEKIEMVNGKLFYTDAERETMLCLLLENIGADRVVQFGSSAVWKAAVAKLDNQPNQMKT